MDKTAKILFAGDVYIQDNLKISLGGIIADHDLAWVNLEGPVITGNDRAIAKVGPSLKQADGAIDILTKAGFNAFSLANNHIWDYGVDGFENTKKILGKYLFIGAGTDLDGVYSGKVRNINGVTIGFLAVSEWGFGAAEKDQGFAWINHDRVNLEVKKMKKKVDFLIVQTHAGLEAVDIPLPEWRQRYKQIVDSGADLIVGHHPHVVQPLEKYKGKNIFYSLGDFYFGREEEGVLLSISVKKSGDVVYKMVAIKSYPDRVEMDQRDTDWITDGIDEKVYGIKLKGVLSRMWNERYRNYYTQVVNRSLWGKMEINEFMLEHNLKIESHYWTVCRYLTSKR